MYVPVLDYPSCISDLPLDTSRIFSDAQLDYFKKYVTGLITSANKTVQGINRLFVFNQRNQSSFNRFFTSSQWDVNELNRSRLALLQTAAHTRMKDTGVIIIDDTHNEKYGDKFAKIAKLFDHVNGGYHLAHDLVTCHYSDAKTDYPLGFRVFEQMDIEKALSILDAAHVPYDEKKLQTYSPGKQRSKIWRLLEKHQVDHPFLDRNDLTVQLLDEAFSNGFDYPITFDTWFTAPKVVNHIENNHRYYVGQLKSNRNVWVKNDWQHIGDWTESLIKDHENPGHNKHKKVFRKTSFYFKGVKKTYWAFTKVVKISKLGRKRVVISFKNEELSGDPKFFVCNNKGWDAGKILSIGRHRWPVEPFYEVSKGFLGLDRYELRDPIGVEKHWDMVFFAYSLIKLQNPGCLMRCGDDIQTTFGDGVRAIQKEVLTAVLTYCYESGKQGKPLEQVMATLFPQNS